MLTVKMKKQKEQKICVIKGKIKYEDYKNCLEAAQIANKINHLEENKFDVDSLKEFIKTIILKTKQRFWSEKHNAFTEEINEIALSSNDDKRIIAIDSVETCAHGTSKDLVYKKEEIKCNNIMKQYKNV